MPAEIQHRVRGQQFGQVQEQESSRPQRPQQQQQQKDEPGVPTSNGMKLMDGRSRAVGVAAWAVNVLSSVTLIMTNKAVMSTFGFTFATTLTGLHFAATAAVGALKRSSQHKQTGQHGGGGQEHGTGSTSSSGSFHQPHGQGSDSTEAPSTSSNSSNSSVDSINGINSSNSNHRNNGTSVSNRPNRPASEITNGGSASDGLLSKYHEHREGHQTTQDQEKHQHQQHQQQQQQQEQKQQNDPMQDYERTPPFFSPMAGVGRAQYVLALVLPRGLPAWVLPRGLPAWELLLFGVVADVSIASMNFSLMLNSIGFYQISKLSVLPAVCLLEALFYGKPFSAMLRLAVILFPQVLSCSVFAPLRTLFLNPTGQISKLSVLPAVCLLEAIFYGKPFSAMLRLAVILVTLGVGVCIVTDFAVTLAGAAVALVAVLSTALQQVLIGALQRKHNMSSLELLSQTAPIQASMLLLLGPPCDSLLNAHSLWSYRLTLPALACIGLSCLLSIVCNLSQYMCLGRFSATSFQVLGNLKTVLVLLSGWLLFGAQLTTANVTGMVIAMGGMMLYSYVAQKERQAKVKAL